MVMQAYDFLELSRRHGCRLQMGGSDQWGNIVNGVELGRRIDGTQLFGLTTPLITTAAGQKMGKTAAGAVWLDAERAHAVRVLAVLAQHRGCRCRPLPAPVHRAAAGRDRRGSSALDGRRAQRGQEGAGVRGDQAVPRRRGGRAGGRGRARRVRGRRRRRWRACRWSTCDAARLRSGHAGDRAAGRWPASPPRTARRAGWCAAAAPGSTTSGSTTRPRLVDSGAVRDGHIKLSAGRKRHVLVRPA